MTRPARPTQNLFTPVATSIAGNEGTDRVDAQDTMGLLRRFRALMQAARNQFVEARVQTGLTGAELWALAEVRRRPAIRVTELARSMSIHQTTASNLVMVLVRAGLVEKQSSASDRRWVTLAATAAGERVLDSTSGPHQGILPAAIERLSDWQREALTAALEPLLAQLDITTLDSAADTPLAEILDTGGRRPRARRQSRPR
ncbi:MAG TPA: MarR family winged helix-turn-helix transcriptional regulator [Casimicrobium huifangae]|uniref:MarR family winged helix-turn-helix transcriptional regulator n=1 Tax=Casimicrobium huifangae TaxID=2591109 RepID=UPI0012EB4852|nr:MarR family winged helix-turn-helix transcriptional regulator [Casimicrobium huifangae]HOB03278.1 MarR family winged helix-turn-helix transcriptional regulator [Casimicrobium huifangae]HQA35412.1 MarR family winged helix-turn-helix transcriptional regulator [Casimicrobium huifangae]HQD66700.1 MarR family winged helix-turn-helix transcriptional regulator [Casimicrobium huifangae]